MAFTDKGFQRLTYDEHLSALIESAKLHFGEDIETSEGSVMGKWLRLLSKSFAESHEDTELTYLSAYPSTASGVSLDRCCRDVGITRNPATHAQHTIKIVGTAGTTVSAGFLVASGDVTFYTLEDCVIGDDESVSVVVECTESGSVGNVAVGSIDTIVNPVADVTGITHEELTSAADDTETDYALRLRYAQALASTGSSTADAIKSAILQISGVEAVLIEENDTDTATADGIPPHSFRAYVLAPESAQYQIAQAIFKKKPLGVGTDGDVALTVTDTGGGDHTIKFSYTEEVLVHVKCTIVGSANFSSDTAQLIKDSVVEKLAGYTNGQDVTATSLYSAIYNDGVADVTELTISADGTDYSTSKIEISNHQVARAIADNIEVTVDE